MKKIEIAAFELAQRFIGIKEVPGSLSNPQILSMLQLDADWPKDDGVPWCSGFVNYVCWLLRLPRSKSLMARSWLGVGVPIHPSKAEPGFSVVVVKQSIADPGPTTLNFRGHVGFLAGISFPRVHILGGNQADSVSIAEFDMDLLLGIRDLLP